MTPTHTNISLDESASNQIVEAVAEIEDTDQIELPPLFNTIDPEALDTVVQEEDTSVSFQYAGYEVEVCGRTEIIIQKPG